MSHQQKAGSLLNSTGGFNRTAMINSPSRRPELDQILDPSARTGVNAGN